MMTFTKVGLVVGVAGLAMFVVPSTSAIATKDASIARAVAQQPAPQAPLGNRDMTTMRQNMMAMRQKMMAEAGASDTRLQQLVDTMNAAKGEAKVEAMAALLAEMVQQHKAAAGGIMQTMMPGMMQMMGMMAGMSGQMRQMMAQCPMMNSTSEPAPPK